MRARALTRGMTAVALAAVLAVAVLAGCGDEGEAAPAALVDQVTEVRSLAAARDAEGTTAALAELRTLVEDELAAGELEPQRAEEILATAAEVEATLPLLAEEPEPPAEPEPPDDPSTTTEPPDTSTTTTEPPETTTTEPPETTTTEPPETTTTTTAPAPPPDDDEGGDDDGDGDGGNGDDGNGDDGNGDDG